MRAQGRLAVIAWLGGAVSIVPFAEGWFDLERSGVNWALFGAVVSAAALGFAIAGPPEPRARALVLAAVFAGAGALAMLLVLWLSSS
jgi:hypothetical protein